MKKILILTLTLVFFGCTNSEVQDEYSKTKNSKGPHYASDLKDIVILDIFNYYVQDVDPDEVYLYEDRTAYTYINKEEIIKTISIADSISIHDKLKLVFYSYSIKSDIVRGTVWVREFDNKQFFSSLYFSAWSHNDHKDFEHMTETEAEELEEKIDDWEDSSSNVWWAK